MQLITRLCVSLGSLYCLTVLYIYKIKTCFLAESCGSLIVHPIYTKSYSEKCNLSNSIIYQQISGFTELE